MLVAAGLGLRGHQHQAGARRNRLGLRWMAERAQDAEYCDVGGEDTEANRSDYGEAENDGHIERIHDLPTFDCRFLAHAGKRNLSRIAGDQSVGATLVPIPNTIVKPYSADGTPLERARESRPSPAPQ